MAAMNLKLEIDKFNAYAGGSYPGHDVTVLGTQVFKLSPKASGKKSAPRISLMGLVHGNEPLGLLVLNQILADLRSGVIESDKEMFFVLGNVPAALAGQRYLETDLNRSFGKSFRSSWEEHRAAELETLVLDQCDFLIDLHQTATPTQNPFFIFQYLRPQFLSYVRQINPGLPTVLQREAIGTGTGLTSDEYLVQRGGFGTTVELGQIGFEHQHFNLGYQICRRALIDLGDETALNEGFDFPVLEISDRFVVTENNSRLHEGWCNFKKVNRGDEIGSSDQGPLRSPYSGLMLFPKYTPAQIGQELFYLCRHFEAEESSCLSAHEAMLFDSAPGLLAIHCGV